MHHITFLFVSPYAITSFSPFALLVWFGLCPCLLVLFCLLVPISTSQIPTSSAFSTCTSYLLRSLSPALNRCLLKHCIVTARSSGYYLGCDCRSIYWLIDGFLRRENCVYYTILTAM